jgi:hypothetical protein
MASPLSTISPDTRNHVLDYLPLRDCFRYSQVSHQCLREVLPNLKRRRSHQFCQRHAYQLLNPCRLVPVREIPILSTSRIDKETDVDVLLQPINGDKNQWHILPSITERIQALYRALPVSHSSSDNLRQLLLDLQQEDLQLLSEQGFSTNNLTAYVQELRSVSKAHRLHELMLSQSTISSYPPSVDRGFAVNALRSVTTTTLHQYIGDVLIAYFLMGHSVAGMVEGLTTHGKWTQDLLDPRDKDTMAEGPIHWYRRWIFLQSTLLRTFPMTRQQLAVYKLVAPLHGILGRTEPRNVEYIHPHYCFLASGTSVVGETTRVVRRLVRPQGDANNGRRSHFDHETRYHQFGPLGPAFRGRDLLEVFKMEPSMMVDRLESPQFSISPTWQLLEEGRHFISNNASFDNWFAVSSWVTAWNEQERRFPDDAWDDVSFWMMVLGNECYKNRPMTVEPPLVTILPQPDEEWE